MVRPVVRAGATHVYHLFGDPDGRARPGANELDACAASRPGFTTRSRSTSRLRVAGPRAAGGQFPVTDSQAGRILSLPMFAELTSEQIEYVVDGVRAALNPPGA